MRNVMIAVGLVIVVAGASFGQVTTATDVTRAEYTAVRNAPEGGVDHVTYLSIRPDPDKVLPAGWVNPVIAP